MRLKKNLTLIVILLLAVSAGTKETSLNAAGGMIIKKTGPDRILMHAQPKVGDYAVYSVNDGKRVYEVTTEIISEKNGLFSIKSTDGTNSLYIVADKKGYVKQYGSPEGGFDIPESPVSYFSDEKVKVDYNSKEFSTIPFFYSWEISAESSGILVNAGSLIAQYYVAYSVPDVNFGALLIKCETVMHTGSERTMFAKIAGLALMTPHYLFKPHSTLSALANQSDISDFISTAIIEESQKSVKRNMEKQGIKADFSGDVLTGDFGMKLTASFTMRLTSYGNKKNKKS